MKLPSLCFALLAVVHANAQHLRRLGDEVCELPSAAADYSVVTTGDATIGAHNMYKGLAIGGTLYDGSPNESGVVDKTKSYIKRMASNCNFNFNGGKSTGSSYKADSMYERFKYLAENAVNSQSGNYKVFVETSGGTFDTERYRGESGQGEDNGQTLVIFNTHDDITLTKTRHGRQFGPTVIAPFSKVIVKGDAGYVDGSIYCKTLVTTGGNQGQLQLHGDTYKGPISCGGGGGGGGGGGPAPAPTPSGGYCNWSGCNGDVQGGDWCNANGSQCGQCGGKWCGSGPAPTDPPTKSPTKSPTKAPTSSGGGGGGYCNWSGCNGDVQGGDWCNESGGRCGQCGGTWCSSGPPPTDPPTKAPVTPADPICLPKLDFDYDGDGKPTSAGDIATNLWSKWGLTITSGDSNKPPMLFDTKHPTGGDTDLADDVEGMVLIISEDGDTNDPDDNAGGGWLYFDFATPIEIDSIGLFDLEESGGKIKIYDASGSQILDASLPTMHDGAKKRMTIGKTNVGKIKLYFKGSGALTDFTFCEDTPPATDPPTKAPVTSPPTKAPVTSPPTKAPVTGPPSKAPVTGPPSKAPVTSPPTKAPYTDPPAPDQPTPGDNNGPPTPGVKGDPHFKTFGGEMYDFHGECDLVLLHNPEFKNNLGMDIHIRTKIEEFWSSVETAAIRIGDSVLEIKANPGSEEWLWIDGHLVSEGLTDYQWNRQSLSGFLVRYKQSGPAVREALIYLGGQEVILLKTFKSFVRVDVNWKDSKNYDNSIGLLGSHAHNGLRLARDGETFIENTRKFGQEWQVGEADPKLFHSYKNAVVGRKCIMPPTYTPESAAQMQLRKRRLGESSMTEADAEKACIHLSDPEEFKACVFDVLSTQDLDMAGAW